MSGTVIIVLFLTFTIGVWITYHKIFTVYYFSLSKGLMKELLMSLFLGMILTALTLYFWWVTAIVLLLAGLGLSGKTENPAGKKAIMIAFLIAAVAVAIVGIRYKAQMKENVKASAEYERIGDMKDDQAVDIAQTKAVFTEGNIEATVENDSNESEQEMVPNAPEGNDVIIQDYSAGFVGTWVDTAYIYQMDISPEGDKYWIEISGQQGSNAWRTWSLESTSGGADGDLFYSGVYVDLYLREDGTVGGGGNPCDAEGVISVIDDGMLEWISKTGELPSRVQFIKN